MAKIERNELKKVLDFAEAVLGTVEAAEFLVDGKRIQIIADQSVAVASLSEDLGTFSCDFPTFMSAVRQWPEKEIEITISEGELLFTSTGKRKRQAGVRMEEAQPEALEIPTKWKALPEGALDSIFSAAACAANSALSFPLSLIHVGKGRVEACDNFKMIRIQNQAWKKDHSFSASQVKTIKQLAPKEVSSQGEFLWWKNPETGGVLGIRVYEETFPDLDDLITFEGSPLKTPPKLDEGLNCAEAMSESENLRIHLHKDKIVLRGEGAAGWYEETRKVKFEGTPFAFEIPFKVFRDALKRNGTWTIGENRLKIESEDFVFVASLLIE